MLQPMKNVLNWLSVLTIYLIVSGFASCKHYKPPKAELCIVGDSGYVCNDPRLPKDERDYILPVTEVTNYMCTNPRDYNEQITWWFRILEKLEKCEADPKNCKPSPKKGKVKKTGVDHFK